MSSITDVLEPQIDAFMEQLPTMLENMKDNLQFLEKVDLWDFGKTILLHIQKDWKPMGMFQCL